MVFAITRVLQQFPCSKRLILRQRLYHKSQNSKSFTNEIDFSNTFIMMNNPSLSIWGGGMALGDMKSSLCINNLPFGRSFEQFPIENSLFEEQVPLIGNNQRPTMGEPFSCPIYSPVVPLHSPSSSPDDQDSQVNGFDHVTIRYEAGNRRTLKRRYKKMNKHKLKKSRIRNYHKRTLRLAVLKVKRQELKARKLRKKVHIVSQFYLRKLKPIPAWHYEKLESHTVRRGIKYHIEKHQSDWREDIS